MILYDFFKYFENIKYNIEFLGFNIVLLIQIQKNYKYANTLQIQNIKEKI